MTDYDKLEERRQMARSNYYAQMAMMGYDNGGNALDLVEVVRCRNCKHRPIKRREEYTGFGLEFPDGHCPCQCEDGYYNWYPSDDWFCANGKRKDNE